jgi:hypothetical protein
MLPVPFHYLVVPSKLGIEIGKIVPGKFAPDWPRYMAKGCKIYWPNDEPIDQGAHKHADQANSVVARETPRVYGSDVVSMAGNPMKLMRRQVPFVRCCPLVARLSPPRK